MRLTSTPVGWKKGGRWGPQPQIAGGTGGPVAGGGTEPTNAPKSTSVHHFTLPYCASALACTLFGAFVGLPTLTIISSSTKEPPSVVISKNMPAVSP